MTLVTVKERYSLKELVSLALPGLPTSERGLRFLVKREEWPFVDISSRGCRGIRREYQLPAELAQVIAAKQVAAQKAQALAAPLPQLPEELVDKADSDRAVIARMETLAPKQRARFEARRAVVAGFFEWLRLRGGKRSKVAYEHYVSAYNGGHLFDNGNSFQMLSPARGVIGSIGLRSLQRWVGDYEAKGLRAFLDEKDGRKLKGQNEIERQPALRDLVLGLIIQVPHIKVKRLVEAAQATFVGTEVRVPDESTFYRFVKSWKARNAELHLALTNPDAWRNKNMVAHGDQSEGIVRPNQRWELDSSPVDVLLEDGRWNLVGCVDVYTGRAKFLLTKTSTAAAVGQLLRACILEWGMPEEVKTDNGSDYTSHFICDVLKALAVEQALCPPFQPWHKPHVERMFKTFQHDLVELLPGYVGHSVAERKAIESRKAFSEQLTKKNSEILDVRMNSEQFNAFMRDWLKGYHGRPHGGLGGQSPDQVYAASAITLRRLDDERVLDVLLAEAPGDGGYRTVQKKGLKLDGAWFIAPELGTCVGERVRVKLDETDLGWVYVFNAEGEFLCKAACPERTGINRQEYAAKAKALQKERLKEQKQALKQAGKVDVDEVLSNILRDRASEAGKLVTLPKPAKAADSQGIQAAREALTAGERPATPAPRSADMELVAQRLAQSGASRTNVAVSPEMERKARFKRYQEIQRMLADGQEPSAEDLKWALRYAQQPECRSQLRLQEAQERGQGAPVRVLQPQP